MENIRDICVIGIFLLILRAGKYIYIMMKLDIVLITYNQAQYIAQAMDGMMMQRVNPDVDVRVIVADDASSDDTLAIIHSYEKQSPFPFVYLPAEGNMGHVLNYKRAFAACTGDYVAILEGDDWWCNPYHLQKHLDFLDEHRECVLSSARPYLYDMRTQRFGIASYPEEQGDVWLITAQEEAAGNKIANLSTCVIRNNVLQEVCQCDFLWKIDMLDWLMEILLAEHGFLVKHKQSTSVYRVQDAGLWSRLDKSGQKELVLHQVEEYDALLAKRYTKEFDVIRRYYNPPKLTFKKRLLAWCPPIVYAIAKAVLPPKLCKSKKL